MGTTKIIQNHKANQLQTYPLSHGQSALWFHYKMDRENVAYNLAAAVTVSSDTDLEALRRALQKVAERHPMLRTLFRVQHDEPVQYVQSSIEISYQYQDASSWQPDHLDKSIKQEVYSPLDLEQGPTWRVKVFLNAPTLQKDPDGDDPKEHLILLVFHHILADLWSSAIILSEVAALYREQTTGIPASLRTLRKTYWDHIYQENENLANGRGEAAWNYWQNLLSGELTPLSLSTKVSRPDHLSGHGAAKNFYLDSKLTKKLQKLAEKQDVPLYTLLLTAYQTLLYR